MCPDKEEFNKVLVSTISEVLDFSDVILNFLELNSSFRRGEIVDSADSFSRGLRELFGDSGAAIEDIVVKRLYERLSLPSEISNSSFDEKIRYAYDSFNGIKRKSSR